ncbi:enoyl-CoA hydratase/isomerase family protein [Ferrovibrio sp.]|uniref:enoyl-CoA hydratase/isomerase family protein n=1 Tax=Ferrovibrio sp. TaxID=1917215 RepID=UPI003D14DA5E
MNGQRINLSITDGIARLVMAGAARRNAVDLQWCREFSEAAIACAADDSIKLVVISAEGDFFSVGGDIDNFIANRTHLRPHVLEMASLFHLGIMRLHQGPAPVISAVNGMAAGGGFSIAILADIVLAKRSARFVAAYTSSGLSPDGGLTYNLPRIVGARRAFELMALNPVLSADQALELGLVTRVFEDASFEANVETVVQQVAAMPAGALPALKKLMASSLDNTLQQQLDREAESVARLAASPATLDVLDAFLRRRNKR